MCTLSPKLIVVIAMLWLAPSCADSTSRHP